MIKNNDSNTKNIKNIYITKPILPELKDLTEHLQKVWDSGWLTNMGDNHNVLEKKIQSILKVKNLLLFNNGTNALLVALKALNLPKESEVITTPFTFAATPHCISWNGLTPVFCDIEPSTMCIDANKIESLITPKTSAILGVHVYGFPCDVKKINLIAQKYNLKVIYDAAHAFSAEINGKGIGTFGDITMFSFHATKLFNTIEGGCLTFNDIGLKQKIINLRNFGILSEEEVCEIGINGKLNEVQAVIGLLNLKIFKSEQRKRSKIKDIYDFKLLQTKGIRIPNSSILSSYSFQYYPIIIENEFPLTRDELHTKLAHYNIFTRKYFYPLCSDYECYKTLNSSSAKNLDIANKIKNRVLCLPFYGNLDNKIINKILDIICSC